MAAAADAQRARPGGGWQLAQFDSFHTSLDDAATRCRLRGNAGSGGKLIERGCVARLTVEREQRLVN
jgi:hypothetical protein